MSGTHRFQSHLAWHGSTGAGYAAYPREHRVVTPPAVTELRLSSDPAFRGDAALTNPEQPVRITRLVLRPQIVVAAGTDLDTVLDLVREAHEACYVANTLNAEMLLEPAVEHAAG